MSETVEIFGKSYKAYETTYADKAVTWRLNAPVAYINIGRFTIAYQYGYERDWGMSWVCWGEPDWEDTPEENYFNEICHAMRGSCHDASFIDDLLEAMKKKPFNQGEAND
jgi:hypothetical protein